MAKNKENNLGGSNMGEDNPQERKRIAVVLVRGMVKVPGRVKDTLAMLKLPRKNQCIVFADNLVQQGMLKKVKDYITWGEISEETFQELIKRRGKEWEGSSRDRKEKYDYKTLEAGGKKYLPYFRLNPPRKGFGRKGIKVAFPAGGALGYRGEKMNDLLRRMI